jgi:predicted amidohydrolase
MLRGADIILVPTACMTSFAPEVTVRSRAFENKVPPVYSTRSRALAPHSIALACFVLCVCVCHQIFIAYVNRAGDENGSRFCGLTSVVAPDGYAPIPRARHRALR